MNLKLNNPTFEWNSSLGYDQAIPAFLFLRSQINFVCLGQFLDVYMVSWANSEDKQCEETTEGFQSKKSFTIL